MYKKISEMTDADKAEFLRRTKESFTKQYGIPWEVIEKRIKEDIENAFDDEKFANLAPDARIDAAYARKAFGDQNHTHI